MSRGWRWTRRPTSGLTCYVKVGLSYWKLVTGVARSRAGCGASTLEILPCNGVDSRAPSKWLVVIALTLRRRKAGVWYYGTFAAIWRCVSRQYERGRHPI